MAAPKKENPGNFKKGNQFWKWRTKHGRDRIIQSAVVLADASDEYFQKCIDNPIIEIEYMSAGGKIIQVEKPHPRVFQKNELARFLHLTEWRQIETLKDISSDFLQVVTCIEGVIANQKFTYATVGMFNARIIAQDLGLVDKTETKTEHSVSQETMELLTEVNDRLKRTKK